VIMRLTQGLLLQKIICNTKAMPTIKIWSARGWFWTDETMQLKVDDGSSDTETA
jgi:hypothetical protein